MTSLPHADKIRKVESFVRENKVGKMVNFELKGPLKKDGIYFFSLKYSTFYLKKKKKEKEKKRNLSHDHMVLGCFSNSRNVFIIFHNRI